MPPTRPPGPSRTDAPDRHSLSGAEGMGHALAGALFFLFATMTGIQDAVAAGGGATGTLFAVHCFTLAMLTWTGAQIALFSDSIVREGGTLAVRRVAPGDVWRRLRARWLLPALGLLALHLALGWLGGGWTL